MWGSGLPGILGKYGARYFSNLGKYSQYIEDPYYPIGGDREDALVIALSESGETQEVISQVMHFKEHGCKILSITNGVSNTLAKMSDYHLAYYVTERMIKGEYNITTQVPVLYLLEALGRRLMAEDLITGTGRKERRMFQKRETPCFFSVTNFFGADVFLKSRKI